MGAASRRVAVGCEEYTVPSDRDVYGRGRAAAGAQRRSPLAPFRVPRGVRLPTVRRRPIFTRGPERLQASLLGPEPRPFPPPPATFGGSILEWAVYWVLTARLGKLRGVDFIYQEP